MDYNVHEKRVLVNPHDEPEVDDVVQKHIIDKDKTFLGMDCEWKATNMYPKLEVALIQIATEECVMVFQTKRFESKMCLPALLSRVLCDPSITKVGVDIENDVRRLTRQFHLSFDQGNSIRGWLDLRCLAVTKQDYGRCLVAQLKQFESGLQGKNPGKIDELYRKYLPKLGLAALTSDRLNQKLSKSKMQFRTNWEKVQLTDKELLYAAGDAAASLDVFLELAADVNGQCDESLKRVVEQPYEHTRIRALCLDLIEKTDSGIDLSNYRQPERADPQTAD